MRMIVIILFICYTEAASGDTMEIITTDNFDTFNIMCNGLTYKNDEIIKYDHNGVETLLKIDEQKDKLTKDLYALPKAFYQNQKGMLFAHSMTNYHEHCPLMFKKPEVNKKKTILVIIQVLEELRSIGINYLDVHLLNFLINEEDIKTIDLDEAIIGLNNKKLMLQKYNLISSIIELYLFEYELGMGKSLQQLMTFIKVEDYFSKYTIEHLKDTYERKGEMLTEDVRPILTDFEDCERLEKILSKMRPY